MMKQTGVWGTYTSISEHGKEENDLVIFIHCFTIYRFRVRSVDEICELNVVSTICVKLKSQIYRFCVFRVSLQEDKIP